jgi:hypothetical protein
MPLLPCSLRRLLLQLVWISAWVAGAPARAELVFDPPTVPSVPVQPPVIIAPPPPPTPPLVPIVPPVPGLIGLVAPACGAVLTSADTHFEWAGPADVFRLTIGTTRGARDLFDSGSTLERSTYVSGLPVDGRRLHVRLRLLDADNRWQILDCTVTAASLPRPALVSPTCGSVFTGAGARFEWAANGWPVTAWRLRVGSVRGGTQYHDSGDLDPDVLGADVTTLPGDGSTVHVRLQYRTRPGGWRSADCSFTAATLSMPALVLPACGSTLEGPEAAFSWGDNGWAVAAWRLRIGSTAGANDLFDSGRLAADLRTLDLEGLPADGETLHVRLQFIPHGFRKWIAVDCPVMAHSLPKPTLTGPACGGSLTGTQTAFAWDDAGRAAEGWRLQLGSRLGAAQYYDSGRLPASARSVVGTGLPYDGRTVHARLRWIERGVWKSVDCTYAAFLSRGHVAYPAEYTSFLTSTCTGSGAIFAASAPCNRSCPGSGTLYQLHYAERGSATPPEEPLRDLNGVWVGGTMDSSCPDYPITMHHFRMTQSGASLSGVMPGDEGVLAVSGDGCTASCSAPGACRIRCDDGSRQIDCSVSCSPATQACRSEFAVTGTTTVGWSFSLSGRREQRITVQCGRDGNVTVHEKQGFDLEGAFLPF